MHPSPSNFPTKIAICRFVNFPTSRLPTVLPFSHITYEKLRLHRYKPNFVRLADFIWKPNLLKRSLSWGPGPKLGQADIEVAIHAVAMDARAWLLCYPRGSFYPLSSVPPTWYRRITKTYFRTCLSCRSRNQAGIYLYAYTIVSIDRKPTFVPLRYLLAGYRPSKTARQAVSPSPYAGDSGKTYSVPKRGVTLSPAIAGSLLL